MPRRLGFPQSITQAKVVLVEGQDEVNVFTMLLVHLQRDDIQVIETGGRDQLPIRFPLFLKLPGFENLDSYAVVQDADDNAQAAFERVRGLLTQYGQPAPNNPNSYTENAKPRVGVFHLPGTGRPGMLENVYLDSFATHPFTGCIDQYFQCLTSQVKQANGAAMHPFTDTPRVPAKAKTQVLLAAAHDAVTSLGIAAEKGYWKFDDQAVQPIRQFLAAL